MQKWVAPLPFSPGPKSKAARFGCFVCIGTAVCPTPRCAGSGSSASKTYTEELFGLSWLLVWLYQCWRQGKGWGSVAGEREGYTYPFWQQRCFIAADLGLNVILLGVQGASHPQRVLGLLAGKMTNPVIILCVDVQESLEFTAHTNGDTRLCLPYAQGISTLLKTGCKR